jgi:PPK2 family polyphosphate:nucleotide phosphotransferase
MNYEKMFRVVPGSRVNMKKMDPDLTDKSENKASAAKKLERLTARLRDLQYHLYSEGKHSLLICLQALDAAGKDGVINHVLGAMNPQGTRVHGFKVPSHEEAAHDFLWRIEQQAPAKGEVVIFNRSHYEDVLVARVHKLVNKEVWEARYGLINDFEKRLAQNGTRILKFFLRISPEEQLERFRQRLDDPARHWKISAADYTERELWGDYTKAYEEALGRTNTDHAPWYVIPSDHKWFRNLAVCRIVAETMEAMKMRLPPPQVDIEAIRRKYHRALRESGGGKRK